MQAGINTSRVFTREEITDLIPLVWQITNKAHTKVTQLVALNITFQRTNNADKQIETADKIKATAKAWIIKMKKLGAVSLISGPNDWTASFPTTGGEYSWEFPNKVLSHFRSYGGALLNLKELK